MNIMFWELLQTLFCMIADMLFTSGNDINILYSPQVLVSGMIGGFFGGASGLVIQWTSKNLHFQTLKILENGKSVFFAVFCQSCARV